MWILKVAAFVLVFAAGALLAPLLRDINYTLIKSGYRGFFRTISKGVRGIGNLLRRRSKKFEDQLIEGLDLLSNSLKSGFSLFQGLKLLSEEMSPPISEEFHLVLQEMKLGLSLEESLQNLARRVKSEELNIVITAIEISQETGGSLSETLERVAFTLREKNKIFGKIKALTSQGRMQALIVGLLPVFLMFAILGIDSQFIMPLFSKPLGWIMLSVAVAMEVTGMVVIRKIMRVDV